jgi:PAS domain S-box-containing protein
MSANRISAQSGLELSHFVDAIPGLVAVLTPTGEVDFVNRQTLEYFGQPLDELRHWGTNGTVHPEDLPYVAETFQNSIASGTPYDITQRLRRRDGVYRWIQNSGFPLRSRTGKITQWCVLLTDIDERKRAEDSLRESEQQFKTIFDEAGAGITLVDLQAETPIRNNRALQKMLGCTEEELGRFETYDDLTHELNRTEDSVAFRELCDGKRDSIKIEKHFVLRDGRSIWANVIFTLLRDDEGKPRYVIAIHEDITERKLAIERLQRNQDLLDLAQKSAGAMAFDWYIQEEKNVWSPEQEALFGLAPGTFDGTYKTWKSMMYAADWPTVVDAVHHAQKTGVVEAEYRVVWPDGSLHWLSTNGRMFFDAAGEPLRMVGFTSDVTRRKTAEVQLAGEKRLLETVATGRPLPEILGSLCSFVEENAPGCQCGVYLIDWDGPKVELAVGPTLPASYNAALEGLHITPETGPCAMAACNRTQVIAADVETDELWRTSPFRTFALDHGLRSCWSTPIFARSGEVLGTFAIYQHKPAVPTSLQQDLITQVTHIASIAIERAQREEALRRSEAFLAESQQLARLGSFSWHVATDQIAWSEQLYRIYEIEPGTRITYEVIRTRVHPEDVSLFEKMRERAKEGDEQFEWQYRLLLPDGSVKHMHAVVHGIRDRNGDLEYIAAVQDITPRKIAQEALDKARAELTHTARVMSLGTLTASIAHEVNQPLSGIITNASTCVRMLDADPPNIDGARETAKRTIRDGNRASDVISRLRAMFRKADFTPEPIDINEAVQEVIELSGNELQRSQVVVQTQLAADLPRIEGDRVQLQQVMLNLLLNGADAMRDVDDRPRDLVVTTESERLGRVKLSIRDVGVGFAPGGDERLFDAFYTTKEQGMGIGLSVSRSIIEGHNGRLWAEPNDGGGAVFSFSIPVQLGSAATRASMDAALKEDQISK